MTANLSPRWLRALYGALILAVTVADQITKAWARSVLDRAEPLEVVPGFFRLVLVHNRGALFGLFQGIGSPLRGILFFLLPAAVMGALAWLAWRAAAIDHRSQRAFALILGGALGNLVDRVRLGHVIDFLDFYVRAGGEHHWPAFNLADSCICIGIALLALDAWRARRPVSTGETHVSDPV